jgi:hypothetical protein
VGRLSVWGADLIDAGAAGGHGLRPAGLFRLAAFIKGTGERRAAH